MYLHVTLYSLFVANKSDFSVLKNEKTR